MNVISFLPAAMAYLFIGLLFTILGFILIYVSHKVYISIYESIPFNSMENLQPDSLKKDEREMQEVRERAFKEAALIAEKKYKKTAHGLRVDRDSFHLRSTKTALRIIVNMEPTYLAYVHFETESPTNHQRKKIVRYFDRLSAIPIGRTMQKCPKGTAIEHIRTLISSGGNRKSEGSKEKL